MSLAGRAEGRRPLWRDRRSLAIVGAVALVVAAVGVPVALWLTSPRQAQLLIVNAGGRPSAMIEDGDSRVLILNTDDREEALSLAGRLSPVLASNPSVVIAPPGDKFAPALLAVVEQFRPAQVIVAGAPGAAPDWTVVEQACRRLGIGLRYTGEMVSFDGPALRVAVLGTRDDEQAAAVVVRRGGVNLVIALTRGRVPAQGQILVTDAPEGAANVDLVIATNTAGPPRRLEVVIERGDVVRVAIDPSAVRIYGGTRREPASERGNR